MEVVEVWQDILLQLMVFSLVEVVVELQVLVLLGHLLQVQVVILDLQTKH
jgi:hypothetical protein